MQRPTDIQFILHLSLNMSTMKQRLATQCTRETLSPWHCSEMLNSEAACREFLATQSIPRIARQIRHDQELYTVQSLPGILVQYLSAVATEETDQIALKLCPGTAIYGKTVVRAQYAGIVSSIKSYLDRISHVLRLEKLPAVQSEEYVPSKEEQSIHQIPYEDVISAHFVNTFVPLILLRELLSLIGSPRSWISPSSLISTLPPINPSKPLRYIINFSSREGIFESSPASSSKEGHYVHTNITKAALNILTETEASPAWRLRRVAVSSVDPGHMSAAPKIEEKWKKEGREQCPIRWEDGAGRVLWPMTVGKSSE